MAPQSKSWACLWRELLESATGRADAAAQAAADPRSCSVPQMGEWRTPAEVESYAAACLRSLQLHGWSFGWDRAQHRLGCCHLRQRRITLSRYFVETYLERDRFQVWRTLLHELAHALAWERRRHTGHGAIWRTYCRKLGLEDEHATAKCDDFAPARLQHPPKFALVHADTGEVFATYRRAPRRTPAQWRRCYIPGRKDETLGKLKVVALEQTATPPRACAESS